MPTKPMSRAKYEVAERYIFDGIPFWRMRETKTGLNHLKAVLPGKIEPELAATTLRRFVESCSDAYNFRSNHNAQGGRDIGYRIRIIGPLKTSKTGKISDDSHIFISVSESKITIQTAPFAQLTEDTQKEAYMNYLQATVYFLNTAMHKQASPTSRAAATLRIE